MKILIIGGGIAARRYVESLIWIENDIAIAGVGVLGKSKILSKEYMLDYYDFNTITKACLDDFSLVIVCCALEGRINILNTLVNRLKYTGRVILEKPFALGKQNIYETKKMVSKLEYCFVVCQRDFALHEYHIYNNDSYNVIWYSITDNLQDNIVHMLPHLLSWFIVELKSDNIVLNQKEDYIYGKINNKKLKIMFEKSQENYVKINDTVYKSPNYRKLNSIIVDSIFNFSKSDSVENINRAIKVSTIISNLINNTNKNFKGDIL